MKNSLDSIFTKTVIVVILLGLLICICLFYLMMKFADDGNLIYVVLTGIGIGVVSTAISKYIRYEQIKKI